MSSNLLTAYKREDPLSRQLIVILYVSSSTLSITLFTVTLYSCKPRTCCCRGGVYGPQISSRPSISIDDHCIRDNATNLNFFRNARPYSLKTRTQRLCRWQGQYSVCFIMLTMTMVIEALGWGRVFVSIVFYTQPIRQDSPLGETFPA